MQYARNRKAQYVGLALCCAVFSSLLYGFGFFDTFEKQLVDRFFVSREAPKDVLILAIDNESIEALGQWPWPRSTFATLLRALDTAAVIGIDVNFSEPSRYGEEDDALLEHALRTAAPPIVVPVQIEGQSGLFLKPLPRFEPHVRTGVTNVHIDADGVARVTNTHESGMLTFGNALLEAQGTPSSLLGSARIDYVGPARSFTTLPLVDVVEGRLPAHIISGKTVLIGATAEDLQDFVMTPFGRMPGVEFHANTLTTFASALHFSHLPKDVGVLCIAFLGGLVAFLVYVIRRTIALLVTLMGLLALFITAGALLFGMHSIIPLLYLILALLVTSGVLILFQYVVESKDKRFIHDSFKHYLAPDVIDEISKNPSKLTLGGEKKKLTILFSDIRGFTTLSESLTPEDLMKKLNVYLTDMTDAIMERRGLVDKYIGDAVMAFWGAPLQNDSQEHDAALTAIEMIDRLQALNTRWEAAGESPIQIGIGIATGEVVVGNMGSKQRFNYTIIGDEVNFAARLEGLTKSYGVHCLIGETTKKEIEGLPGIYTREVDRVVVKGKKEPRRIYELLTTPPTEDMSETLGVFEKGRQKYEAGAWDEAIAIFETVLRGTDDGPSRLLLERSHVLKENPPEAWDGVYEFTTK